jgi:hypothetical protein
LIPRWGFTKKLVIMISGILKKLNHAVVFGVLLKLVTSISGILPYGQDSSRSSQDYRGKDHAYHYTAHQMHQK